MPENGVAMGPNETRDLMDISAADHSELYPAITHIKKIGDAGSGGSVDFHTRVALIPNLYPPVQLVSGHLTEVVSPHAESKDRGVTQLGLYHRLLDNVVVAG